MSDSGAQATGDGLGSNVAFRRSQILFIIILSEGVFGGSSLTGVEICV